VSGLLFFAIVGVALVLVLLDIVVRRRRGAALAWALAAGVVLVAGGALHAGKSDGPWPVVSLVLGAICLTLSDRATGLHDRA
jgi:hypothetical protein